MWITAIVMGFAGSLHCVGMCSPLAMAVTSMKPSAVINRLLYNGGRIATYGLMGAVVSGAGLLLPLKYQNLISVSLGILLLVIGIAGIQSMRIPVMTSAAQSLTGLLKTLFAKLLKKKGRVAIVVLGALNGLLPCGLTFIALTFCLTLKGPSDGVSFMLLFGAGTLPAMIGFTGIIASLVKKFRWSLQATSTTLVILSGAALIARVFIVHLPHATPISEGIVDIILCR